MVTRYSRKQFTTSIKHYNSSLISKLEELKKNLYVLSYIFHILWVQDIIIILRLNPCKNTYDNFNLCMRCSLKDNNIEKEKKNNAVTFK